jgi:hypothetical protein
MAWLIQFLPVIWKFLKHFGIYLLLAVVLVGGPYLLYRKGFNDGYKSKVCPPTYTVGAGGVVNNHYNADDFKFIGAKIKCLFINLRLGY